MSFKEAARAKAKAARIEARKEAARRLVFEILEMFPNLQVPTARQIHFVSRFN
jgi:hypothetical protein